MRILIVEDNPTNEKVARQLLKRLGHEAVSVTNGLEAVESLRSDSKFECILMDLAMPVMDGISATKQILKEHPDTRPRIIAVTANAFETDRDHCLDAGMDDFLTKPLRLETLRAALENLDVSSPAEPRSQGIDIEQFLSIIDGSDPECIEIFDDYCADVPGFLEKMKGLSDGNDPAGVSGLAHQLKGSSATFGLVPFANRMSEIERAGKSGNCPPPGWEKEALAEFQSLEKEVRGHL